MPSKRYMILTAPVEHLNGKLSLADDVVHNELDTNNSSNGGFYYGYRKAPGISRFGRRERARNLANNPYTQSETANRTLFETSIKAVDVAFANAELKELARVDFVKQEKYKYLRNFAIARTQANNGVYPWTA